MTSYNTIRCFTCARSNRNAARHQIGIHARHRRNPHFRKRASYNPRGASTSAAATMVFRRQPTVPRFGSCLAALSNRAEGNPPSAIGRKSLCGDFSPATLSIAASRSGHKCNNLAGFGSLPTCGLRSRGTKTSEIDACENSVRQLTAKASQAPSCNQ